MEVSLTLPIEKSIDFTIFLSYLKLLRTAAWAFRFVHNVKSSQRTKGKLSAKELTTAEKLVCR